MKGTDQLDLFGAPAPKPVQKVGPARVGPELVELGARLHPSLRMGTSSWSFPGWAGLVYDREARTVDLARDGLAAYARHPLLRSVGIDRSYYGPLRVHEYARYAQAVPETFRFLVKAHEWCNWVEFPRHRRYGAHSGQRNPFFLDPGYATDEVVGPCMDGLGERLGVMLFQFPPQELRLLSDRGRFVDRLHRFLDALPKGPVYAIEVRNHQLFSARYLEALLDVGAVHCLNLHPQMHEVTHQIKVADPLRFRAVVVRWMLARRYAYEEAKQAYAPFDVIVDEDLPSRRTLAQLCRQCLTAGKETFVIVNNKAEGCAPTSVELLARAIVGG